MHKKYGAIIFYFAGALSACILLSVFALYRVHRDQGRPLTGSSVFGDVSIITAKADGVLPDVHEMLQIKLENQTFLALFFDDERKISQIIFRNNEEDIASVHRSRGLWRGLIYGNFDEGAESYTDIDCDGTFDIRIAVDEDGQASKFIYAGEAWARVAECNWERATLRQEDDEDTYLFKEREGWQRERDKYNRN